MKVLESSENYLETIYILGKRNGNVRAVDIANEMGFSKASVSVAMKQLKENNFISVTKENLIKLEEKGLEIAQKMYERHVLLSDFFIKIGVSEKQALTDACKIEHVISDETFFAVKKFLGEG